MNATKDNTRNNKGVKDSSKCYRTFNGVLCEHFTSDPNDFQATKRFAKENGLICRIINGECYLQTND